MLSLDVMDISGEHQNDLEHDISKTRLGQDGTAIETTKSGRESLTIPFDIVTNEIVFVPELKGDVDRANLNRDPSYCGSCYGASPPESG